jgi:uncharacterized membrane protein YphA (DoxX/SURF4 family)
MNVFLWIVAGVLAAVFGMAGVMKATSPREKLAKNMAWVNSFSDGAVKGIGAAEALGAIGLIVPRALNIAPVLTPIAALCLAVTMVGAVITHVRLKEAKQSGPAIVLLILCVIVAAGRF